MAVIPASQLVLMRKRRQLHQLIKTHQWEEVSRLERELFNEINAAVNDAERSPKELLHELSMVINLYKELSKLCRLYSQKIV